MNHEAGSLVNPHRKERQQFVSISMEHTEHRPYPHQFRIIPPAESLSEKYKRERLLRFVSVAHAEIQDFHRTTTRNMLCAKMEGNFLFDRL